MSTWFPNQLDKILQIGDKLCLESILAIGKKREVSMEEVLRTFIFDGNRIQMEVNRNVQGNMFPLLNDPCGFNKILEDYFQTHQSGVLKTQKRYFALWQQGIEYFHLFRFSIPTSFI